MKTQKHIATFSQHNRGTEAFNVKTNQWEAMPEEHSDSDFHFNSEDELNERMKELGVVIYEIHEAFWPEELD